MNDSLNNKELVAVGHLFAKAMSSDTPIIDMAKIVSRLAERLDCTTAALREMTKQRDALAAENGQMLRLLTDISENNDEYVNQDEHLYAGVPMDYVSEVNAYVSRDIEAENPFIATDVFMANARADAITAALESLDGVFDTDCVMERNGISYEAAQQRTAGALEVNSALINVAFELRKGASV